MKHSPLPWRYDQPNMCLRDSSEAKITERYSVHEDADGKLIVRAVNSHDELVEALEGLLDSPACAEAWRDARAALSKAKGTK